MLEADFDPVRLRKIEILTGIVCIPKITLVLLFSEFRRRLTFFFIKFPLI